jgi:hypothetical protein
MNRPTFNEKTEVKVISHDCSAFYHINGKDKEYDMYGWRGKVTEIIGLDDNNNEIAKPYAPENYPTKWCVNVKFTSPVDDMPFDMIFDNWPVQLAVVQKKFIDIENLREHDEVIGQKEDGTDIIRKSNAGEFDVSDIIQITTKIDGANASIAWDETTQKLEIFSRTNLLDNSNSLRGFYDYIKIQIEPKVDWSKYKDLVFFGEWCVGHSIKSYNKDWFNKWRVYDIWNKERGKYLDQTSVKALCHIIGLEYIEELYYGPFISWDHCRSFMNKSIAYGPDQEGIVVKNQAALFRPENRFPAYLKIVNESFKETMKVKPPKEIDPEVEAAKKKAIELANSIVTKARVKKMILKLVDEGLIPENLTPKDMGLVMKHLPKRVYEDVLKEELETVKAIGENASKIINTCVAQITRKIVIGN